MVFLTSGTPLIPARAMTSQVSRLTSSRTKLTSLMSYMVAAPPGQSLALTATSRITCSSTAIRRSAGLITAPATRPGKLQSRNAAERFKPQVGASTGISFRSIHQPPPKGGGFIFCSLRFSFLELALNTPRTTTHLFHILQFQPGTYHGRDPTDSTILTAELLRGKISNSGTTHPRMVMV